MSTKHKHLEYESPLAPLMEQLVREKRACGYKYDTSAERLKDFDRFLCQTSIKTNELPKSLVLEWLEKRPTEKAGTNQSRIILIRQLARLMIRLGYPAFLPPNHFGPKRSYTFSPYILTHEEIRKIIHAADQLQPNAKSPWRNLVMPELFRLLYSCGFRVSEVLNLRVRDVDLKQGVITIRRRKYDKDRLVPPALDMVERLRLYSERMEETLLEKQTDNDFFFSSSHGQAGWSISGIYFVFRKTIISV